MTTDLSDAGRQRWNARQAPLRHLLEVDQALPHHAAVRNARFNPTP